MDSANKHAQTAANEVRGLIVSAATTDEQRGTAVGRLWVGCTIRSLLPMRNTEFIGVHVVLGYLGGTRYANDDGWQ